MKIKTDSKIKQKVTLLKVRHKKNKDYTKDDY